VKGGLWRRLTSIAKTDVGVLLKGGVSQPLLADLERVLLEADFGGNTFAMVEDMEKRWRAGTLKSAEDVRGWLRNEVARLAGDERGDPGRLAWGDGSGPGVILMLGVNGVGKTTQTAKLAQRLGREGRKVLLAAADTFRAGASEQLQIWATRLGVPCVTGTSGGDPAAVVFDALDAATARGANVVLVDTAGRLHTQQDLLEELKKIVRVVSRRVPGAPHETFLVLDGTVGQNAVQQGRGFSEAVPLTGLIITKLDGTAKGGAVVQIRRELGVPIRFVGVGEQLEDLEVFDAARFADRLLAD
jgi:fused signal recognition particle receptor